MNELFSYYEGELDVFISESLIIKDTLLKRIISSYDSLTTDKKVVFQKVCLEICISKDTQI